MLEKINMNAIEAQAHIASSAYMANYLRKNIVIDKIMYALSGVALAIASGVSILAAVGCIPIILYINKSKNDLKKYYNSIVEYLTKNTPEYQEAENLYRRFVKQQAILLKKYGFKDPLEIAIAYSILMYSGVFSVTNSFEPTNGIELIGYDELKGAQIATGKGVCRHIASNLQDILAEMNLLSCEIYCAVDKDAQEQKKTIRPKKIPLIKHVAVALETEKGKIIYDPTEINIFRFLTNGIYFPYSDISSINNQSKRLILLQDEIAGKSDALGKEFDLANIPNSNISDEEFLKMVFRIDQFIEEHPKIITQFAVQNSKLIEDLANAYARIGYDKEVELQEDSKGITLKLVNDE